MLGFWMPNKLTLSRKTVLYCVFFLASVYNHAEKHRHIDESVTPFFLTTSVQLIFLTDVFQKHRSPQNP